MEPHSLRDLTRRVTEGGGSDIILDEDGNFHDVEVEANTTVRIYLPIYKSDE